MLRRLRQESGFGLVELLIAMLVLNIAILATVAAFSSGLVALNRANRTATAAVLADVQMERLRAIRYCDIRLNPTIPVDATYTGDAAMPTPGTEVPPTACAVTPEPAALPTQTPIGADGHQYRVDIYMAREVPVAGARELKKVTVVVRDPAQSLRVLTRQTSTFEEATG